MSLPKQRISAKSYPARLYEAESGEAISIFVQIKDERLLVAAVESNQLLVADSEKGTTAFDGGLAIELRSLDVSNGGSDGDKLLLRVPASGATIIINSHEFHKELEAQLPLAKVRNNFAKVKFNRMGIWWRQMVVYGGILCLIFIWCFVIFGSLMNRATSHSDDSGSEASEEEENADASVGEEGGAAHSAGAARMKATKLYLGKVQAKVNQRLRLRIGKAKGKPVGLLFVLNAAGKIQEVTVVNSAGAKSDMVVVAAFLQSAPFGALPKELGGSLESSLIFQ
jgi:hypothetical protein